MREHAFAVLCATTGIVGVAAGVVMLGLFAYYHAPGSTGPIPTGPVGHYFVAFAGTALAGWGGCLLGVARHPSAGRPAATATAMALALMAAHRMMAWVVGDYHGWFGDAPRLGAAAFLVLGLAFLWLRPAPPGEMARRVAQATGGAPPGAGRGG